MSETLRMNAYYYSFDPTGVRPVDRVLSAVAEAGESYHNTSEWTDDTDWQGNKQAPHPEFGGASCAEWIQNAANDAAAALAAETARADREAAARQEAERDARSLAGKLHDAREQARLAGIYRDRSEAERDRLRADLDATREALKQAFNLLQEVLLDGSAWDGEHNECHYCGNRYRVGHAGDCVWAQAWRFVDPPPAILQGAAPSDKETSRG